MIGVDITINLIGMSIDDYSQFTHLYKPYFIYKCKFCHELNGECLFSELISMAFNEYKFQSENNTYSIEELYSYSKQYIRYGNYFVGCISDKPMDLIGRELGIDKIYIEIFVFEGGASLQSHGYTFIVHPNEDIHKYSPHIHVKRDEYSVRYSLDTFERYEQDNYSREYLRDEKKIIIPFLKKNSSFFWIFGTRLRWDMKCL